MLSTRKLSYQFAPLSTSVLLPLVLHQQFKVTHISDTVNHKYNRSYLISSSATMKALPVINRKGQEFRFSFCTVAGTILVQARDPSKVALQMVNAVESKRYEDAWNAYEKHTHMDGLPRRSDLNTLIIGLAESFDAKWLARAYSVVEAAFDSERHESLERDSLIYLSFILARCDLPILATNIIRKLVQIEVYPPLKAWSGIIGHMCQSSCGAFLAAELIMEIGYLFNDNRVDPRKKRNRPLLSMKPDSFVFNLALTGCLLSGTTKKAEQLLEVMPRIKVKPNAASLIVMARIYEKNGRRDELKKLKRHVDEACGLSDMEFQLIYDCMLSCHLKFGDLDSATDMILDMLRKANAAKRSLAAVKSILEAADTGKASRPCQSLETNGVNVVDRFKLINSKPPSYSEFAMDSDFSRLEAEAKELHVLLSDKLQGQVELVSSQFGILHPTEKIYAKLVRGFLDANRINDLAAFIIKANKEVSTVSTENSFVVQVIQACISLNLLDQAHDLLDEMRFSSVRVGSSVYSSLLKAYCKANRQGEVESLMKDARKAGVQFDASCYEDLIKSRVHCNDTGGALHMYKEMRQSGVSKPGHQGFEKLVEGCAGNGDASLMSKLLQEIKYTQKVDSGVHDWNSVIYFFCKKRLMGDAQKALNKMRTLGHTPNAQTFHSLVTGYASVGGRYTEVTDLWGEMKGLSSSTAMKFDQELLDSLLYCFVRGGFFLRAMEVIQMMEKGKMFIDKYKYRSLWLKYHRTLYKGKAPKVQTEAQLERREAALAFKRWIAL